jgi:hypothetical protein
MILFFDPLIGCLPVESLLLTLIFILFFSFRASSAAVFAIVGAVFKTGAEQRSVRGTVRERERRRETSGA